MIEVRDLRKEYGDLVAVKDVTFTAEAGAIFGLLGPNGAGKTTTIGCVSGLLTPTAGSVRVSDHDVRGEPRKARAELGVVPQELALYEDLTARENLSYWAEAYGLRGNDRDERVHDVLDLVGLLGRADDLVEEFSGGMKRRLNFGCGVVHEPRVLLLDEPTVGVDPQSRVRLLDLVRREADAGTCVLYTTHYMEEAQDLCDRIAIIDHGEIIAEGNLDELRAMLGERDILRLSGSFEPEDVRRAAATGEELEVVSAEDELVLLAVSDATRRLPAIFSLLSDAGAEIQETTLTQPSLESLFIKLTGRELRE